jgi:HNH endonuclease
VISAALREKVAERAGRRCEYCLISEEQAFARHQVDHVIAVKHGGETTLDNLAFCCTLCNRRKGSDLSSLDPATGQLAPLFNPRRDNWHDHFEQRGGQLLARTASAGATIRLLRLNRPDRVKERLISSGWLWTRD